MDQHTIDRYKQEMLAQARRSQIFDPPAAVPPSEPRPTPELEPKPPEPAHVPAAKPMQDPAPMPEPEAENILELEPEPKVEAILEPQPESEPEPELEPEPEPEPEPKSEPKSEPESEPELEPEILHMPEPIPMAQTQVTLNIHKEVTMVPPTPQPESEPAVAPPVELVAAPPPEPFAAAPVASAPAPVSVDSPPAMPSQRTPNAPIRTHHPRCKNGAKCKHQATRTAAASAISEEDWFHRPAAEAAAVPLTMAEDIDCSQEPMPKACTDEPYIEGHDHFGGYFEMPIPTFASLDDFMAQNSAQGTLTIHVLTPEAGTPVASAQVQVTKLIGDTNYLFFDARTDARGTVGPIVLPTPPKDLAYDENAIPYALYDITVTHAGRRQELLNVSMFADTGATQVVRLDNSPPINQAIYTR